MEGVNDPFFLRPDSLISKLPLLLIDQPIGRALSLHTPPPPWGPVKNTCYLHSPSLSPLPLPPTRKFYFIFLIIMADEGGFREAVIMDIIGNLCVPFGYLAQV